jgi:hypothetical protein
MLCFLPSRAKRVLLCVSSKQNGSAIAGCAWSCCRMAQSAITIETIGPDGAWVDISLRADARLRAGESERRYQLRCDELRIKSTTLVEM